MPSDPGPDSELTPPVPVWAERLATLMDDAVRLPGTEVGVGLDALIGLLLPGLGDAASGLISLSLFVVAFQQRVPKVIMLRMLMNVALDTLIGSVPVVGDVLDIFYRANQKNLTLLRRYERQPLRRATFIDYLFVSAGIALLVSLALVPVVLAALIWRWLSHP